MHTEHINKWLTLFANLGVLVGIIFLAVEVRQSNRIAIAATEISVRNQFNSISEQILANDGLAELLVKTTDTKTVFSAVEKEKLYAFMYLSMNTWAGIEIAYHNGMLPRSTFDEALDDIRVVLQEYPALQPLAREHMSQYPSRTDSDVFTVMRENSKNTE